MRKIRILNLKPTIQVTKEEVEAILLQAEAVARYVNKRPFYIV